MCSFLCWHVADHFPCVVNVGSREREGERGERGRGRRGRERERERERERDTILRCCEISKE